jgi:hypothetical protein
VERKEFGMQVKDGVQALKHLGPEDGAAWGFLHGGLPRLEEALDRWRRLDGLAWKRRWLHLIAEKPATDHAYISLPEPWCGATWDTGVYAGHLLLQVRCRLVWFIACMKEVCGPTDDVEEGLMMPGIIRVGVGQLKSEDGGFFQRLPWVPRGIVAPDDVGLVCGDPGSPSSTVFSIWAAEDMLILKAFAKGGKEFEGFGKLLGFDLQGESLTEAGGHISEQIQVRDVA